MTSFRSITSVTAHFMLSMMGVVVLGMANGYSTSVTSEHLEAKPEAALEGISLRERFCLADSTIKGLTESLIEARLEQNRLSHQIEETNDQINLLGFNLSNKGSKLDENKKLLFFVKELRSFKEENDCLREQLLALSEAAVASESLAASGMDKTFLNNTLNKEINATTALLQSRTKKNNTQQQSIDLTSGEILEVKPELSLVITNLGARHGVNVGTPFQVWRNNHRVGTVKVVDVRDTISGAIVQNSTKMHDFLRAGDQLHVDLIR